MSKTKIASIVVIVVILGAWTALRLLTFYVPVGWVGVRTQQYGLFGQKGVVQEDFLPGWHRDLGPVDSWVMFDSTAQTLEMTREPQFGSRRGRDDVQVQSADGYAVSVDATIKYRIQAGNAHQVLKNTGAGDRYKSIVRNEAQEACMRLFGQMKTEDFYDPFIRRETATRVREMLSDSLKDNYVEVIDVLIRDVQFDPEYEKKIRRKKLADQEVELNKSMANAAETRGKTEVIEAETLKEVALIKKQLEAKLIEMEADTSRKIAKIKAEYEKYATEKGADADLDAAQKSARGTLLVKQAEAEGERLRNAAMLGVGGGIMAALEAAGNLHFEDITISTLNIDLLDLDAMATLLGAPRSEDRKEGR